MAIVAGAAAAVVGVVVAVAVLDRGIDDLARAPVGCTTMLDFDDAGTFTVYVETAGAIGELAGDCDYEPGPYRYEGDALPEVDLTLVGGDGEEIAFGGVGRGDADYDSDGSVATAMAVVEIDLPGRYELSVESDERGFTVAVGRRPTEMSQVVTAAGLAVGAVLAVVGLVLLGLGLRRRRDVSPAAPTGPPASAWPPPTS